MKEQAIDCMKMYRLARILNVEHAHAVGLMEMFWRGVRKDAPHGSLRGIDSIQVAIWCKWTGDPESLLCALASAKWIDPHPEHQWLVHDWPEHCEDAVHKRLIRERRWFADGTAPKITKEKFHSAERAEIEEFYRTNRPPGSETGGKLTRHGESWRNGDSPGNFGTPYPTVPNPTLPNPTVPSSEEPYGRPETVEREGDGQRRRAGPKIAKGGLEPAAAVLAMAGEVDWLRERLWQHARLPEPPDRDIVRGLLDTAAGQGREWWQMLLDRLEQARQRPGKTYGWYLGVVERAVREGKGAA